LSGNFEKWSHATVAAGSRTTAAKHALVAKLGLSTPPGVSQKKGGAAKRMINNMLMTFQ
jgi:hypothetical protein